MFGYTIIKKKELIRLKNTDEVANLLVSENWKLKTKLKEVEKYIPNRNSSGRFCKK